MDLFSNLQLLHEAAISVLVTTTYGRWRGTTTASPVCLIQLLNTTGVSIIQRYVRLDKKYIVIFLRTTLFTTFDQRYLHL